MFDDNIMVPICREFDRSIAARGLQFSSQNKSMCDIGMANSGPALNNVISSALHWCKRPLNGWLYIEKLGGGIDVPFTLQNVIKVNKYT